MMKYIPDHWPQERIVRVLEQMGEQDMRYTGKIRSIHGFYYCFCKS